MNASEAIARRVSIRAFTDQPVDKAVVAEILEKAARAPSGGNLQPWRVYAITGAPLAEFKARVAALGGEPSTESLEVFFGGLKLGAPKPGTRAAASLRP